VKKSTCNLLYLDNAATSWPKPPEVARAMSQFLAEVGANPGRSGHRLSIEAARIVYDTREALACLFGIGDPLRVIFGLNITDGLNLALHGLLKTGDHVITSGMEHNAVMRPLDALQKIGVQVTRVACRPDGSLEAQQVESAIQVNTRLIVMLHASNVCGTLLPIREIGQIARRKKLLFMVDSAQTAGVIPIDMQADAIDLLAFTGHKSLYGPMGTGGLIIGERVSLEDLKPVRQGGTGSRSEYERQPDFLPDCYESGTPNAVGIAGLLAALRWLEKTGIEQIREREERLCGLLISILREIPGVKIYGPGEAKNQTATIALNLEKMEPSTLGQRLDEEYGILCRVGLHCAPAAHRTLGTFPDGCVRLSLGAFQSETDIYKVTAAIRAIAKEMHGHAIRGCAH
jgi:cysteine desulfurase family protein